MKRITAAIVSLVVVCLINLATVFAEANAALPEGWTTQDVGGVGVVGNAEYLDGRFSVRGSGVDIWGQSDSFRYAYQPLTGDGQIVARVVSLQNTNSWAKAGVMFRETLAANSRHALMAITPGNGAAFQRRLSAGDVSLHTAGARVTAPYWVKLERSGSRFSGYISADGVNWVLVGSDTISMASTVYVGLAVTSHDNSVLSLASFDGVRIAAPDIPPAVTLTAPANGASFAAQSSITISATATAGTGAVINRVDFYNGTQLLGTATSAPFSYTWNNVPAGSYSLTARVVDSLGRTATSSPVAINVRAELPSPWSAGDIGSVRVAGSASYSAGTFSVSGSGSDIWGRSDAFHYVFQPLNGDGQIIARVAAVQNTNSWAKAGIMIRETLSANSRHALMAITPGNGAVFQRRLSTGGLSVNTSGPMVRAPYWVRLVRSGSRFSGYVSNDGVTWVLVRSESISMTSSVYVGLAVTSHNNSVLCRAVMDGVIVTAGQIVPPTVSITAPADGASYTAPASITVDASATASTGATISRVDFYSGTILIGTATETPYRYVWNVTAAGTYSLTAKVTDSLGMTATSSPVTVNVAAPPSVSITSPADGASFNAPAEIIITAEAAASTGATVAKVEFFNGNVLVGEASSFPYSYTWTNVAAGSISLTAKVTDSRGQTATSAPVTITVTNPALPDPWMTQDIGNVGIPGSAGYVDGTFTIKASGADIWGTADAFRFVYQPLAGDGQIIARVASLDNTSPWAKAGVMIRATLAANSPHALMAITPGNGAAFQRRPTARAGSLHTAGPAVSAPYWVKLVRSGNTLSGYVSPDGVVWELVGTDTVAMATSVYVGLAVTSTNNTVLGSATIDGVEVKSLPLPPPPPAGSTLLQENFDDAQLANRGWFDGGASTSTVVTDAERGNVLEITYLAGSTTPANGGALRRMFPQADDIIITYYVEYQSDWQWPTAGYGPHEFYLLTNLETNIWTGLASTFLTTYIEAVDGKPTIVFQDAKNIDQKNIGVSLVGITENRGVMGCNGSSDAYPDGICYGDQGAKINGKTWTEPILPSINNGTWRAVKVRLKMNSIVDGKGVADGIMQYWLDDVPYISHSDVMIRTGAHPDAKWNEMIIAPYFSGPAPQMQKFWIDDLKITTVGSTN